MDDLPKTFIPYARQWIGDDDIEAVRRVLQSDWLTTGPQVDFFEKELAQFCGARFAVVCSTGTAALHLAALVLGLKQGDSIVTTPITFLATANAARFVGADVVFSDVKKETVNLDPEALRKTIVSFRGRSLSFRGRSLSFRGRSPRNLKAIFPVHFAGQPAEMEKIAAIAKEYDLFVVEDASHALGASYRTASGETARVGSCRHSDLAVFSFHPVKHVACGEGGAITTNNERLYERLKRLRNHGMTRRPEKGPWFYEIEEVGMNYRLTDIQCALGRNQLRKIETSLARRRKIAKMYKRGLKEICHSEPKPYVAEARNLIRSLHVLEGFHHAYHLFPVRIDFKRVGISRADLMGRLKEKGIGTQVHYIPVHLQPYYRKLYGTKKGDFPEAERYYEEALSLPMYAAMREEDVNRVVEELAEIVKIKKNDLSKGDTICLERPSRRASGHGFWRKPKERARARAQIPRRGI